MEPHELTEDEVRGRFLDHVAVMVNYWATESRVTDPREKLEGLAFSILVAIDGESAALPAFTLSPRPHPDDQAYNQANNESWYPAAPDVACDIGGSLHERVHEYFKKWSRR